MSSKISIVVPIYNVAPFIKECLDSLLAQTYRNIEIILVNDGSEDESGKICDEYKSKDIRIVVIHQDNAGVGAARNRGMDAATGKYILFIDPDDWVAEELVETLLVELESNKTESSLGSFERVFYSGDLIVKRIPVRFLHRVKNTKDYVFIPCPHVRDLHSYCMEEILIACAKLFDLEIIKKNNIRFYQNLHPLEDTVFSLEYFSNTTRIATTDQVLYFYRQRYEASTGLSAAHRDWVGNAEKGGVLISDILKRWPGLSLEEQENSIKLFHSFYADMILYSFFRFHKICSFSKTLDDMRRVSNQELFLHALQDYVPQPDASVLFPYFLKKKKLLLAYFAMRFHFLKNKFLRSIKSIISIFTDLV